MRFARHGAVAPKPYGIGHLTSGRFQLFGRRSSCKRLGCMRRVSLSQRYPLSTVRTTQHRVSLTMGGQPAMQRASVAKLILCCALVVGCTAPVGRNFTRSPADTVVLGKTTRQDIVNRMGIPFEQSKMARNEVVVSTATYKYWVPPAYERFQNFFYVDDVLVGHQYSSTAKEDSTDFDVTLLNRIRKSETTESEVMKLLGRPSGEFIYPFIKDREAKPPRAVRTPPGQVLPFMHERARGSLELGDPQDARGIVWLIPDLSSDVRCCCASRQCSLISQATRPSLASAVRAITSHNSLIAAHFQHGLRVTFTTA